jgi:hypothetical protein
MCERRSGEAGAMVRFPCSARDAVVATPPTRATREPTLSRARQRPRSPACRNGDWLRAADPIGGRMLGAINHPTVPSS